MNALLSPFLILFLAAASVRQQPATRIRIQLTGTCSFPTEAFFVFNGDEDRAQKITLDKGIAEMKWKVHAGDYASLRIGKWRTNVSTYEIDQRSEPVVAVFQFKCSEQTTTNEKIDATQVIDFTYCRRLPNSKNGLDHEVDEFGSGHQTITITNWRFSEETIRLLLFSTEHNCTAPALDLKSEVDIKQGRHEPVSLDKERIVANLCKQPQRIAHNCREDAAHDSRLKDLKLNITTP